MAFKVQKFSRPLFDHNIMLSLFQHKNACCKIFQALESLKYRHISDLKRRMDYIVYYSKGYSFDFTQDKKCIHYFTFMSIKYSTTAQSYFFLFGFYELQEYVFSNLLFEKMIYHKIHSFNISGRHELCICVSSKHQHEKMICHKIHICNLCGLHELCKCVSSNLLLEKMI